MDKLEINGYLIEPVYSELNHSGLLHIKRNGESIRELHFPCKGVIPTNEEIQLAIDTFFDNLDHKENH